MVDLTKHVLASQMEAALRMLDACVDACPDESWDAAVCDMAFCQVVFHALFFTDCYLSPSTDAMLAQPFHRENAEIFRDYEELKDKKQELLYDRPSVKKYMAFCRTKAAEVIAAETEQSLASPTGFDWLKFSRAELHIYNARHIHHHAAQLSLRLRLDHGQGVRWVKSGA
jgi:hypothetical protein